MLLLTTVHCSLSTGERQSVHQVASATRSPAPGRIEVFEYPASPDAPPLPAWHGFTEAGETASQASEASAADAKGSAIELVHADVSASDQLTELDGRADLVVANPPYVPDGALLEPEVTQHDPHHAVFGGPDGMALIGAVVGHAGRWLRPGGLLAVEHDDTTSAQTVELIAGTALFDEVVARRDLAGRPRFVTARKREEK